MATVRCDDLFSVKRSIVTLSADTCCCIVKNRPKVYLIGFEPVVSRLQFVRYQLSRDAFIDKDDALNENY